MSRFVCAVNVFVASFSLLVVPSQAATLSFTWAFSSDEANQNAVAAPGDRIEIDWTGDHNVWMYECDGAGAQSWDNFTCPVSTENLTQVDQISPAIYDISATQAGGSYLCFVCARFTFSHCRNGMHLTVLLSSSATTTTESTTSQSDSSTTTLGTTTLSPASSSSSEAAFSSSSSAAPDTTPNSTESINTTTARSAASSTTTLAPTTSRPGVTTDDHSVATTLSPVVSTAASAPGTAIILQGTLSISLHLLSCADSSELDALADVLERALEDYFLPTNVSVSTVSLLCVNSAARYLHTSLRRELFTTHTFTWAFGSDEANQNAVAAPGDQIEINWNGGHDVYMYECDGSGAQMWDAFTCPSSTSGLTLISPDSPATSIISLSQADGSYLCFVCSRVSFAHCRNGMHLTVLISSSTTTTESATTQSSPTTTVVPVTSTEGAPTTSTEAPTSSSMPTTTDIVSSTQGATSTESPVSSSSSPSMPTTTNTVLSTQSPNSTTTVSPSTTEEMTVTHSFTWVFGTNETNQNARARPGDRIEINWTGDHNVWVYECDGAGAQSWDNFICPVSTDNLTQVDQVSPAIYDINAMQAEGTYLCFVCARFAFSRCQAGMHLTVLVSSSDSESTTTEDPVTTHASSSTTAMSISTTTTPMTTDAPMTSENGLATTASTTTIEGMRWIFRLTVLANDVLTSGATVDSITSMLNNIGSNSSNGTAFAIALSTRAAEDQSGLVLSQDATSVAASLEMSGVVAVSGDDADDDDDFVHKNTLFVIAGGGLVIVVVLALIAYACASRRPKRRRNIPRGHNARNLFYTSDHLTGVRMNDF